MDLALLACIPPQITKQRREHEIREYLRLSVVNMVGKIISQVNKENPSEVPALSFWDVSILDIDQINITLKLQGKPIQFILQEDYFKVKYNGNTSSAVELVNGEIECAYDSTSLFTSKEDNRRVYKELHVEALIHIADDTCNNRLRTVVENGEEVVLCSKTYRFMSLNCSCNGMPTYHANLESPESGKSLTLRDKLFVWARGADFSDPFDKNLSLYFDCKYDDLNPAPFVRQVVESLSYSMFDMMERYERLKIDLHQYPILLARKYCHIMLLSHRHGTSPLSQLPKDVLRYMLQYIWRTRYDVDTWFP